jgi:hypothetical protein
MRTLPLTRRLAPIIAAAMLSAVLFAASPAPAAVRAAALAYSTDAPMILQNVPIEDLQANRSGICNGDFTYVLKNSTGVLGATRYLDAAQKCGLKVILFFSDTANHSNGLIYPSRVSSLSRAVRNHPALYGYLTAREPSLVGISGAELRSLYKAYKAADPNHPVVVIFGDVPHFGDARNPYTAGMADVVMVDWYPVETASRGCSRSGLSYVATGPKWFSTKVRPTVARKTPGVPIWVMVQTHRYLAPACHKKQRPTQALLERQVREAIRYAGAQGIAFHTFQNTNYTLDQHRDPTMVSWMKQLSKKVRAGTFQ